jgi:hypothetical protein
MYVDLVNDGNVSDMLEVLCNRITKLNKVKKVSCGSTVLGAANAYKLTPKEKDAIEATAVTVTDDTFIVVLLDGPGQFTWRLDLLSAWTQAAAPGCGRG